MMATQTKMIIITSDEDIIRQFHSNKSKNTRVIDLDDEKQVTTAANDNNNIMNMALLTELSELNSNNDHVFKRALDSTSHNRPKPVKLPKKSTELTCTVCGDRANGYNYDAVSCASCKSFFRRNAHQNIEKVRCLTGQDQCSVAYDMRRKCQKCRLNRCLAMGMRKDFVMSEEDKQKRRERLEENRNKLLKRSSTVESTNPTHNVSDSESISQALDEIDRILMDMDKDDDNIAVHNNIDPNEIEDSSLIPLSAEERAEIQNVQLSFLSHPPDGNIAHPSFDVSDHNSALIYWSNMVNQTVLDFISFFRQIDEFEGLHADDRFILIKYNLFPIYPVSKCYNYKAMNGSPSYEESEEAIKHREFYKLCFESFGVARMPLTLVVSLVELTEQDPTLISLLLAILIFTHRLSMNKDEPALKDSLAVCRAQLHYTRLLWNYMANKYGETETCKKFTKLLTLIFQLQSATKTFRECLRDHLASPDIVDQIEPLMRTVLHIS